MSAVNAINERILISIVRADAMPADVHRAVTEAIQGGFGGVVVAPVYVPRVAAMLRSEASPIELTTVVGFPNGTSKPTIKAIEATSTIKDGAAAIHVVPFLPNLIRGDVDAAKLELMEIARAARATRRDVMIHVIVESSLLIARGGVERGDELVTAACRAARESGCDGVVSDTGLHAAAGATVQAIHVMRRAGEGLTIFAAGKIRDLESARAMIETGGADRVVLEAG